MIVRQIVQKISVNRVLAEYSLILFEAKAAQPIFEIHDIALLRSCL